MWYKEVECGDSLGEGGEGREGEWGGNGVKGGGGV